MENFSGILSLFKILNICHSKRHANFLFGNEPACAYIIMPDINYITKLFINLNFMHAQATFIDLFVKNYFRFSSKICRRILHPFSLTFHCMLKTRLMSFLNDMKPYVCYEKTNLQFS